MGDIEDVGLDVRLATKSHFDVKVRTRIPKRKNERLNSIADDVSSITVKDKNEAEAVDDCQDGKCDQNNCCKDKPSDCKVGEKNELFLNKNSVDEGFFCIFIINIALFKELLKSKNEKTSPDESNLTWRTSIYLRTWGCSHNNSDSEYMGGLLQKAGYTVTDNADQAGLWLLNSCTVKTPSETQLSNQIKEAQSLDKHVVVAGCVSQV